VSDSPQQHLAELRHDLANPLNHVLGFTELLVQGARERAAHQDVQVLLQQLTRAATEVRHHLDEQLGAARIREMQVDLQALRAGISRGAEEILGHVAALRPLVDGGWGEAVSDLDEVRNAAMRLQQMVAPGSLERAVQGRKPESAA
jgi:signal transduction histidine kinase